MYYNRSLKDLANSLLVKNDRGVIVVYHKEDNDGVFSAAIMGEYLRKELDLTDADITFVGEDYNSLNKVTIEDIGCLKRHFVGFVMLDISFSDPYLMKFTANVFDSRFSWVDHHAPAIAASVQNHYDWVNGVRQVDRSALMLTYKYCYDSMDIEWNKENHGRIPTVLKYLSAWDSFTFDREGYTLDMIRTFNEGTTFHTKLDLEYVSRIIGDILAGNDKHDMFAKTVTQIGSTIVEFKDNMYADLIKHGGDTSWTIKGTGEAVTVVFTSGNTNSIMFKTATTPHGAVFKRLKDGNWVLSLYNKDTSNQFHCGEYLRKNYKGGGHTGAAGCQLTETQLKKLLKTHAI